MTKFALMTRLLTLILIVLILPQTLHAQAPIRVMTWNTLWYGNGASTRNDDFRQVIDEVAPIILCTQEMASDEGGLSPDASATAFKTNVLDVLQPGLWSKGPNTLMNSYGEDSEIFYRSDLVTRLTTRLVSTEGRSIEWGAYQIHGGGAPVCTLIVAVAHPKAGNTTDDAAQRSREIDSFISFLENTIPAGYENQPTLFCGDLNVYTSNEASYQTLLTHFADPINTPGNWNNNQTFAAVHTQSTRSYGGGLDDRFDQILADSSFFDGDGLEIDVASYTAFGNDGDHYNTSINDGQNSVVGDRTADALYYASDHLPVYVDLYHPLLSVDEAEQVLLPASWGIFDVYPNPFNGISTLRLTFDHAVQYSWTMRNELGQTVYTSGPLSSGAGNTMHSIRGENLTSGLYFLTVDVSGESAQTKRITLLK